MEILQLHRFEAQQLLNKLIMQHAQVVAEYGRRTKLIAHIIPFNDEAEDLVANYLAKFEQEVLVRYQIKD